MTDDMVLAAGKHSLESSIVQGRSFVFQQALSTELSSLILSFFFSFAVSYS